MRTLLPCNKTNQIPIFVNNSVTFYSPLSDKAIIIFFTATASVVSNITGEANITAVGNITLRSKI